MTEKKIWLITGASRSLGVDLAKAALKDQVDAYRDLSTSLALNDWQPEVNHNAEAHTGQ